MTLVAPWSVRTTTGLILDRIVGRSLRQVQIKQVASSSVAWYRFSAALNALLIKMIGWIRDADSFVTISDSANPVRQVEGHS